MSDFSTHIHQKKSILNRSVVRGLTLGIIAFFYVFLVLTSENIPFAEEDRYYIFQTVNDYEEGLGGAKDVSGIFDETSGRSRVPVLKAATLLDYLSFGKINIHHIVIWASLMLLGLWSLLYFSSPKRNLTTFLPVTMLLFTPVVLCSNWAYAAFTYSHLLFFAFAALFFLSKKGWIHILLATIFGLLAVFTHDWGLWVFPAGLLVTMLPRLRKAESAVWLLSGVLAIVLYFFVFPRESDFGLIWTNLSRYPDRVITDFFVLLGSPLKVFFSQALFAGLGGVAILTGTVFLFRKYRSYFYESPLRLSFTIFLLIILTLIALTSGTNDIAINSLSDEYQLFIILYWINLFLILTEIFDMRSFSMSLLAGLAALFFIVRLDYYLPRILAHNTEARDVLFNKFYYLPENKKNVPKETFQYKAMIVNSVDKGFYEFPDDLFPKAKRIKKPFKNNQRLQFKNRYFKDEHNRLELSGWASVRKAEDMDMEYFVALENHKRRYMISHNAYAPLLVTRKTKMSKRFGFKKKHAYSFGIPKNMTGIMPGKYRVGIAIGSKQRYWVAFTEKTVVFE